MKDLKWLTAILAPLIGLVLPEIANLEVITTGLLTGGGYIGLIVLLSEGIKRILTSRGVTFDHMGVKISLLSALLLGFGGWFFQYGIFEHLLWWHTLGVAIISWGASNRWYDITLSLPKNN